jgi:ribosome-binding protein aMBF1 (putative translation factor)
MQDGFFPSHGSNTRLSRPRADSTCRWARRRPELIALGAAVREVRARRGLSQEQLGFQAGLHRNYVGGIERGELNLTFRVLLKLVHGLGVPLSELVALYERNRTASQLLGAGGPAQERTDERPVGPGGPPS